MTRAAPPTLDQRRARHAWDAVSRIPAKEGKDYLGETKKLPVRILNSGLGHALAFLKAKNPGSPLLGDISSWVLFQGNREAEPNDLLEGIVRGSGTDLRRHTAEALAYLRWLTRFAEAKFKKKDADGRAR